MAAPFLEVVDLVKNYKGTRALDHVSFQVSEGEMFGLLGPNGAGKTTLLSIVSCLLDASAGSVRLQGRPAHRSDKEVRRRLGIVPQELAIYGELTARENLLFFGGLYGLNGAGLRRRVDEVLQAVGLDAHGRQRVSTFSGGMKRRLNLGAALVHEPRLLLLDEPTTGVDPQSRNHIFEEVRRLHAAGVTIVYTSHYMEEVEALCPRIGIIDHGRLIACDKLPNLLRQLTGLIRFGVADMNVVLRERLEKLPNAQLIVHERGVWELECRDVQAALLQLLALLNEQHVELLNLQTEEPNLERVFLHLTGRALRD
jgi:ABC-2 type transport system ATP-binding protein